MLPKLDFKETRSYQKLKAEFDRIKEKHLRDLFSEDKDRFEHFHIQMEEIPVSYTHLRAHETVLDLVCRLLLEKKHTSMLQCLDRSNHL